MMDADRNKEAKKILSSVQYTEKDCTDSKNIAFIACEAGGSIKLQLSAVIFFDELIFTVSRKRRPGNLSLFTKRILKAFPLTWRLF